MKASLNSLVNRLWYLWLRMLMYLRLMLKSGEELDKYLKQIGKKFLADFEIALEKDPRPGEDFTFYLCKVEDYYIELRGVSHRYRITLLPETDKKLVVFTTDRVVPQRGFFRQHSLTFCCISLEQGVFRNTHITPRHQSRVGKPLGVNALAAEFLTRLRDVDKHSSDPKLVKYGMTPEVLRAIANMREDDSDSNGQY